jgi:hypothetical protein
MSDALTGIELRPDSCVLAHVSRHGSITRISAVHTIAPDQWPASEWLLSEELEHARKGEKFPRNARVVRWGESGALSADDAALAAFTRAGFRIEAVVSPAQALALLAASRPRPVGSGAAAWLALNRHGAAIAIVSGGAVLFSRVFTWAYRSLNRPQDQLLQRYSLVAHVAPELRHGIEEVGRTHGVTVDSIVTCGDLPDLRSLTMPLTEEFDLEVETLDTGEGLDLAVPPQSDRGSDWLPAVRLAVAAAGASRAPDPRRAVAMTLTAAAAVALVATFGYWVYAEFLSPFGSARRTPAVTRGSRPATSAPRPASGDPSTSSGSSRAESRDAPRPAIGEQRSAASEQRPASNAPTGTRGVVRPPAPADRRRPPAPPDPAGDVSNAPLPQVNSILVSPDRRIAVLDGAIVREGEKVGPRVLVAIEQDGVVLREPSGRQVRVPIRGRRPGGA